MIVYSKSGGTHDAAIGRLETPIKMIIEHESDILTKKGGICDTLFNVEKSSRFGESFLFQFIFCFQDIRKRRQRFQILRTPQT